MSDPAGESESLRIALQRSFVRERDLYHFNIVMKYENGEITVEWVAAELAEPDGTAFVREGAVFFFEEASGCRGLRLVGEGQVLFEGCPVTLSNGEVAEVKSVLVDHAFASRSKAMATAGRASFSGEEAPVLYRRGTFESGKPVARGKLSRKGLAFV